MLRTTLTSLLLALPAAARADTFGLTLEPGVAIPLSAPQNDIYDVGGTQAITALFGVTPYFDAGPSVSFLFLPSSTTMAESGVAWGFGGAARLKRPHDAVSYAGVSPWVGLEAFYMRTGSLDRPGLSGALGLSIPIGDDRIYWVGPFLRYAQVIQPNNAGFDNRDLKVLSLGVSLEVGSGRKRQPPPVTYVEQPPVAAVVAPEPMPVPVPAPVAVGPSCADRDADTIPDAIDHCPDVFGTMENLGCPTYTKIIVKHDKLELKEKLYFAWDKAKLEAASFPVLDEVVQALKDNPGFRVQIEGHTDSSGANDHNQMLSEQRAAAVLDYITAHGIAKDRLISKGFSSSVPIDTNDTVAGRENNRRVEFVVNFIIVSPPK